MKKRLSMVGSALSQLLCVSFTRDVATTNPNESISSRAYRLDTWLKPVINRVFFLQEDHCKSAYLSDVYDAEALLKEHKSIETEHG